MSKTYPLARRTFLKGLGVTMALPLLECMLPVAQGAASAPPVRMAFVFFPNGAIVPNWKSAGDQNNWQLSRTLAPLADHKDQITVFNGLTQHHGRANGDGAGDHARCAASFLTGAQPVKTAGANIRLGISIDQAAAELIGRQTRLPSLELGVDRGRTSGNCDSGYSCAYSANISWKTPTTPMAKEINPKLAFERLFGTANVQDRAARNRHRKSILDMVAEDAAALKKRLGRTDQRKIAEYLTCVRELEQRIERDANRLTKVPDVKLPAGIPRELETHMRLMFDIMALAFQTDTTRICTFMLANAGSNRSYPTLGVSGGHHSLSHHKNEEQKMEDITRIDTYLVSRFATFLDRLKAIREGERTLLDNSLIVYGSAIGDGNRHTHHDLPIVLAGTGGAQFRANQLRGFPKDTPLNNLFLSMCHMAGAKLDKLGDSTGPLTL